MIENLERQAHIECTKDEKTVDKALRSTWFDATGYDKIVDAYESHFCKTKISIKQPFQVAIAAHQLAKRKMLEF